ncbi:hypothetical protein H2201_003162 [Coniosporium apollinis]|uniref:Uncharacterized protein n=1 Tax=Coniosporium apollinis TaxID=61459 RepID=A0ABQ9P1N0_9PEZI|nr:hypothetical protein H2201_003162 [Coniosporium apollinis]
MQMSEALAQKQKKIEELAKMMNTLTTKHKTLYEYTNRLTIKHKMLHEYARRQHLQLQRFRQLPGAKIVTTRAAAWNRGGNVVAMAQRVHVQPPTPGQ